jgi:hypothetical protein
MKYNENYYHDGALWQRNYKPHIRAINTYLTKDGIVISMFQGNRGQYPEIDFIVRVLKPGIDERPFPPPHLFWVVDLMMKINDYKTDVREILEFYLEFYDLVPPFESPESRIDYKLKTVEYITEKYKHIEQSFTLSLEYVTIIIELFCINEKRNEGAYMFRDLLKILLDYIDGKADYIQVMQASKPGFR